MDKHISKISSEWTRETRAMFIRFPEETGFSNPERPGEIGVAVQISQLAAYRKNRSTWRIRDDVLGI